MDKFSYVKLCNKFKNYVNKINKLDADYTILSEPIGCKICIECDIYFQNISTILYTIIIKNITIVIYTIIGPYIEKYKNLDRKRYQFQYTIPFNLYPQERKKLKHG